MKEPATIKKSTITASQGPMALQTRCVIVFSSSYLFSLAGDLAILCHRSRRRICRELRKGPEVLAQRRRAWHSELRRTKPGI